MKEDVLEQIVDDYLQMQGYFTTHNVRFKPSPDHPDFVAKDDRVPSDIDVLGVHPRKRGVGRVRVVSCKAWQVGFNAELILRELNSETPNEKPEAWRRYRELWVPKWAQAFRETVAKMTGSRQFTYSIAVTKLTSPGEQWTTDPTIQTNLAGNPFRFLTLECMWLDLKDSLGTTPASSEVGRLAQLLKAADL
jgi:hypothetical protein